LGLQQRLMGISKGRRIATMSDGKHWVFFDLPPMYTMQPVPGTLQRQLSMWADILLDHAASGMDHNVADSSRCSVLRLYSTSSPIFANNTIQRALKPDDARNVLEALVANYPQHCAQVSSKREGYSVLIACNEGGFSSIEQSILLWLLEESGNATTTAELAKSGVVLTFDELVDGRCLYYKTLDRPLSRPTAAHMPASLRESLCGVVSDEVALRALLDSVRERPNSALGSFKVTLFNLDGSDTTPYQGIKLGGR
jgi:ESCRT-II complex subunit VPS25